jgi:hypothetical protein
VNAFGRENIDHLLDHPEYQKFMINCIRDKTSGVINYMMKKHFDPKHPENTNIRKLNKKDEFIEINDGKRWKLRFKDDVLDDVFVCLQVHFGDFVDQCTMDIETSPLKKQWLDNFMKDVGESLEWDLTNDWYEYCERNLPESKKCELKSKIYKLALEHIYRNSKSTK